MDALYYFDGQWTEEEPKVTGPRAQAFWLSGVVFDGSRAFNGFAPDVDRHSARLIASAEAMLLKSPISAAEVTRLSLEAVRRFPRDAELYIRPMLYAASGFLTPDPDSTTFILAVYRSPLPEYKGIKVCLSTRRRPAPDMAPTDAKASCLYPNSSRAIKEAEARGFDNAVMLDPNGNVAELASANIWIVKDGVALTPVPNGTFLNGVTKQRVMKLLQADGVPVVEKTITFPEVLAADEVFTTGNYAKVLPIIKVEDRDLQPGPVTQRARDLYWKFAATTSAFH
jgi:branched-chain amino acid aminotransferase